MKTLKGKFVGLLALFIMGTVFYACKTKVATTSTESRRSSNKDYSAPVTRENTGKSSAKKGGMFFT